MKCAECSCFSDAAPGWIALLGRDPDDEGVPAEVIAFCPVCAAREFRIAAKTAEAYV